MDNWYNGRPVNPRENFLQDALSHLIGTVTLRQLRVKTGVSAVRIAATTRSLMFSVELCDEKLSFDNHSRQCPDDYSRSDEDRQSYRSGWKTTEANVTDTAKPHSFNPVESAFRYHPADELDTYPYLGQFATYSTGGYVYELRTARSKTHRNITELRRSNWIDHRTRAVIVQMNLYSANIQTFTSISLLMEFLCIGSLHPSVNIQPLDLESMSRAEDRSLLLKFSVLSLFFRFLLVGPSDRFDSLRFIHHLSDGDGNPLDLYTGQKVFSRILVVDSVGYHHLVVGGHVHLCVASR